MGETTSAAPNPGSDAALARGCTCPVMDNRRGYGAYNNQFWITEGCPLHAPAGREALRKTS